MCHKTVISDRNDRFMTVLWTWEEQFYDTFMKRDTFRRDLWVLCDSFVTDLWKWQICDSYVIVLRHIYDSFVQMIVLWQFYDRYMTDLWNSRDHNSLRVTLFSPFFSKYLQARWKVMQKLLNGIEKGQLLYCILRENVMFL